MTQIQKDDIILKAALEINPEYLYSIKQGTLGLTFYIEVKTRTEAKTAREEFPMIYEGLRTIILYTNDKNLETN
tara:strand:- start:342 stop:563 length:222 start_codon:yes stop_codon:yes gene_type:complete